MPDVPFLDPEHLESLIDRQGEWVDWYRTIRCPCLNSNGQPVARHAVCGGTGYARPYPAQRIRGLVTSDAKSRKRQAAGMVETGTRSFTPKIAIRLSEGDLIVLTQAQRRASETILYGGPVSGNSNLDALFIDAVLSVCSLVNDEIAFFDPALYTDPVTGLAADANGTLLWQPSASTASLPNPGDRVTVEYMMRDVYQVVKGDLPQNRYTEDQRIMDRATIKEVTRRALRGTFTP